MNFTFEYYTITDSGIELFFLNGNARTMIFLTDAELVGVSTQAQLRTLVIAKLKRKLKADCIASKLDALIGGTVPI